MSQIVSAKRNKRSSSPSVEEGDALVLRRSLESRNHLQDLLERSDQKAGFVVTGIAFLGLFLEEAGLLSLTAGRIAFVFYGVSLVCVCGTAWPRKWNWYSTKRPSDLYDSHLERTANQEARASCRQEADLRAIYQLKNWLLSAGFFCLIAGMAATQYAVHLRYR
jgi:hypothetical protein